MVYGKEPVGVRRLWSLVAGLHPHDSAFARATWPERARWTQAVELQASTIDLLQVVLRVLQVAHLKDPPSGRLTPVPRPYDEEPPAPAQPVSVADLTAMLRGG